MPEHHVRDLIPEEDRKALERYREGKFGKIGFGQKLALIVVDMTNAFIEDKYPTGFSKTGMKCVKAIRELLDVARKSRLPIIYTRANLAERTKKPPINGRWAEKTAALPEHLLRQADVIHYELRPKEDDIIITKDKPSAFFGTQLVSILNYLGVDTLIVAGMVTSGCVRATVVDAFSYNYRVIIPEECVADRSQISHKVNLFDMDMKYADVLKLKEVLKHLKRARSFTLTSHQ
jgi:nicotinamidase-related amidase